MHCNKVHSGASVLDTLIDIDLLSFHWFRVCLRFSMKTNPSFYLSFCCFCKRIVLFLSRRFFMGVLCDDIKKIVDKTCTHKLWVTICWEGITLYMYDVTWLCSCKLQFFHLFTVYMDSILLLLSKYHSCCQNLKWKDNAKAMLVAAETACGLSSVDFINYNHVRTHAEFHVIKLS